MGSGGSGGGAGDGPFHSVTQEILQVSECLDDFLMDSPEEVGLAVLLDELAVVAVAELDVVEVAGLVVVVDISVQSDQVAGGGILVVLAGVRINVWT